MKKITSILLSALVAGSFAAQAQDTDENSYVHEQSDGYQWPTDQKVLEKLDKWQDQKFGVLFHWGLYSVPGICESWPLCSEDWITRPEQFTYNGYKDWYWGFAKVMNPTDFDPHQWADIMADAGMKYMIFTTKHHDGFCMFDSKYDDFSIANGPFANDPRKDVARHVFDAFREKDFMIGAYFSKPDWHSQYFWNDKWSTPNRMQNYKREQHPELWKQYTTFVQNQMDEIMQDYGPFDIFWLDGGWLTGEEVGLPEVLAKARATKSPGLISVDRTIEGPNENYQTPERAIPDRQIAHPWESCITLGHAWGWDPNSVFKTPNEVVSILAEITAKGGCLLLGVGPTPKGLIEPAVEESLRGVGKWLRANGEAIYNTRITPVYNSDKVWFTANKDGETLYAIYTVGKNEKLPATITWEGNIPEGSVTMLDGNRKLKTTVKDGKVTVTLPKGLENAPVAMSFKAKK